MKAHKLATYYAPVMGHTVLAVLFLQSTNHFLKNIVVMGFLLHMIGMGSGPHSLNDDEWGRGAAAKT